MGKRHGKNPRELEEWNKYCPPGTEVKVCRRDDSFFYTKTRSFAWDICGIPCVRVEGIDGTVDLDRITIP